MPRMSKNEIARCGGPAVSGNGQYRPQEVLDLARANNITGVLIRQFKTSELRAYTLPDGSTFKIKAPRDQHVVLP